MPDPGAAHNTTAARGTPTRPDTQNEIGNAARHMSFYEAGNVHERIRRWQTQDAARAVDPDILSVRSQPRSETSRSPLRPHSPARQAVKEKEPRSTPRQRSTKWVQQDNKTWVKRRRTVGGDRKTGAESKAAAADSVPPLSPAPTPPADYIRTESQRTRNVHSSRTEREERRRRRREARARANGGNALVDDGIRVYTRSESHPASEPGDHATDAVHDENTGGSSPIQGHTPAGSPQYKSQLSFHHDGPLPDEHDDRRKEHSPVQPSKYAQTLGRPPAYTEALEQPKTRKQAFLNKTKEILVGRSDASDPPSNRMPSIEAWLDDQPAMPDPFVAEDAERIRPARDVSSHHHRRKSHRKELAVEPTIAEVPDPNKIWDSLGPTPDREARRSSRREQRNASRKEWDSETSAPKRRLFSFEVCDEPSKGADAMDPPPYCEVPGESSNSPEIKRKSGRRRKSRRNATEAAETLAAPLNDLQQLTLNRENSIQPDRDISPRKKKSLPKLPNEETKEPLPVKDDVKPTDVQRSESTGLKRKLTTHEDLLSVLSQPRARKSTKSVRGGRKTPAASADSIIHEALEAMRQEEVKYLRELKTLVDGVTPVLLQSLLSKQDAAATAGLFSDGKGNGAGFTRAIIDMGIVLQRLKNLHGRIPLQDQNIDGLLTWAVSAHKSYSDYVKAWRLDFQDVVVNLAPLDDSQMTEEEMLARDIDGDVTNEQGEKVDVAYLQKRPLVRIKRMSKLFITIRDALPGNERAVSVADMYADLTETAKQRHSEEQGRLEDEAAGNIDTTRARDIRTMGPLQGVQVDKTRKVRARDNFDMSFYHSTGQRLDCNIEIILRDDAQSTSSGGDILICQVEDGGRWLLFQPLHLSNVSARRDQAACELVIMLKGVAGIGKSWHELLALRAEDDEAVTEWLHMLGSNPLPPRLNHNPSWRPLQDASQKFQQTSSGAVPAEAQRTPLSASALANLPSDVDVPIGEPSILSARKNRSTRPEPMVSEQKQPEKVPKLSMGGGLQKRALPEHYHHAAALPQKPRPSPSAHSPAQSSVSSHVASLPTRSKLSSEPNPALPPPIPSAAESPAETSPQPRYAPQRFVQPSLVSGASSNTTYLNGSDLQSESYSQGTAIAYDLAQAIEDEKQNWSHEPPLMSGALPSDSNEQGQRGGDKDNLSGRKRVAENKMLPTGRSRAHSRVKSFSSTPLTETIKEQWAALSGFRKKAQSTPSTPAKLEPTRKSPELVTDDLPTPRPVSRSTATEVIDSEDDESPPPPPQHRSTYTVSSSPHGSSTSLPQTPYHTYHPHMDSASPLKHEYQPSSSGSSSDSESDETDATSEISDDDFHSELKDQATPLVPVGLGNRRSSYTTGRPLPDVPSTGTRTLDPSDSASNGPYRRAPPPSSFPASKKKRTIAMVCSWSDRGIWNPITEDECSVVISPGLVQAFPMSAAHSQPMGGADWESPDSEGSPVNEQEQPLVEFELTPIVPLRKGTALDITIRSPPTSNSLLRTTNNVMFRSRTVQECEKLYQYINWARCNNPTYAQLARARAREQSVSFAPDVPQTKTRSWFSFGSREKSSYRASSRPPTSIAESGTSGSSATSAFSALKRFGKNSPFSLQRSSVLRRSGLPSTPASLYSSSNGGSGSGSSTPAPASQAGFIPGPDGPNVPQTSAEAANGGGMVNNMKVRLFLRQGQKWEAMGPSLLTVLPPAANHAAPDSRPGSPGASTPPLKTSRPPSAMPQPRGQHFRLPSSGNTPHRIHGDGREKRILITNAKRKDIILLDETLGESCFEKVMQTGIAVNVWKEDEQMQEYGGVMTGRSQTYMIQFRTSTEATWVFNLCGTYRYGDAAPS